MIWQEFAIPQVRDLAWSCFSADLLDIDCLPGNKSVTSFKPKLTPERKKWLKTLDRNPSKLLEYLHTSNTTRLGLYFEKLWQYFLLEDQEFTLSGHNLAVRSKGRTFGEFDIIYYNHTERCHVHLELALKYYLGVPLFNNQAASHYNQWIGTNCQDTLDQKLQRLFDHQIRLSKNPHAEQVLEQLTVESLNHQITLKGYLFNSTVEPLAQPGHLGADIKVCNWQHLEDFQTTLKNSGYEHWLQLPKQYWLADSHSNQNLSLYSPEKLTAHLTQHFTISQRPVMICAVGQDHSLAEYSRSFVTANNWPSCPFPQSKYQK